MRRRWRYCRVSLHICIYIHIYIYIEREIHIHVYIYICIFGEESEQLERAHEEAVAVL